MFSLLSPLQTVSKIYTCTNRNWLSCIKKFLNPLKLQKLNSSPWRGRFGSFYKLLSRHNTKNISLFWLQMRRYFLDCQNLNQKFKKKKSTLWLQSDPIPFIIKNFYGSSLRRGLIYLTCSRRPTSDPILASPPTATHPPFQPRSLNPGHNELLLFSKCLHSLWGHLTLVLSA